MSFDTMVPAKFSMISRRPMEWHGVVMKALEEMVEDRMLQVLEMRQAGRSPDVSQRRALPPSVRGAPARHWILS